MVEPMRAMRALSGVPWFQGLGDDHARALLGVGAARRFATGELIYREDEFGDRMLIVLEGLVRVEASDADGRTYKVGSVRAGELVGEMAVFDPAPRNASVIAATDVLALELTREALFRMRGERPRLLMAIATVAIHNAMDRIDAANRRIERELGRSAAGRRPSGARGAVPSGSIPAGSAPASAPIAASPPIADPPPAAKEEDGEGAGGLRKIWARLTRF